MFSLRPAVPLLLLTLTGCLPRAPKPVEIIPIELPRLTLEETTALIPATVADREGWAADVLTALERSGLSPAPQAVCSVLAVIEQESGFQADPVVPDLAKIVKRQLDAYAEKLGPLGRPAFQALLQGKAPKSTATFEARLARVRTERDLDRVFQDLLTYYEKEFPNAYATVDLLGELFAARRLEDLNPITTAGSMQVSVRYAVEHARALDPRAEVDSAQIREELYTRPGGVFYGASRLLNWEVGYTEALHRFADYNAGLYTCRNAALQSQVAELTGFRLVPDGDFLAYDKQEQPVEQETNTLRALLAFRRKYAPRLSESQLRRDVLREKASDFEGTETYRAIRRAYEKSTGLGAPYAQLPDVALKSPKMKKPRSTEWFAKAVEARYRRCLEKVPPR